MGTLISLFLAIFLYFHPLLEGNDSFVYLAFLIAIFAGIFFLAFQVLLAYAWGPLGKAEDNFTWRVVDMHQKDREDLLANIWSVFFVIASLGCFIDILWTHQIPLKWLAPIWIVLLGAAIDAFLYKIKKIYQYLSPFAVIQMFSQQAQKSVQTEKELDLCHWLEALSEIAFKALDKQSTSVCHDAIAEIQKTMRFFLESSKRIGLSDLDAQSTSMGIKDKVSYTLFYVFQRLEMINEKALQSKFEMTIEQLISTLGKIALDSAKYDLSLASYPLYYLGKFTLKAQANGMQEIGAKATCILIEVTKAIVAQVDLTYQELQEPFLSVINSLEKIAKETFKQDKSSNITLLVQPFKDLKELFLKNEKMVKHQDTPVLVQSLDRIIGEFNTLEVVLKTMPPISAFTQPDNLSQT